MAFSSSVRHVNSVAVLDLAGRLTLGDGAATLRQAVQTLADEGHKNVLLNFAGVQYVDSSGLGALTVSTILLRGQGGGLRLVNVPARVQELMHLTRLNQVIPIFADEPSALAGFGQ